MQVEIWADVICPWCGIGNHRLEAALEQFGHRDDVERDDVEVVHRSFQLDAAAPVGPTPTVREMLRARYGMSDEQFEASTRRVEAIAEADGLRPYIVSDNRTGNTGLAHQLLAYAGEQGLSDAAWRRLFEAYFGEARSIFDIESLVELASEIGLDPAATRDALESGRYADRVAEDARVARELGTTGVPFVVIDRKYGVAGAQPVELIVETLERAWDEAHPA